MGDLFLSPEISQGADVVCLMVAACFYFYFYCMGWDGFRY